MTTKHGQIPHKKGKNRNDEEGSEEEEDDEEQDDGTKKKKKKKRGKKKNKKDGCASIRPVEGGQSNSIDDGGLGSDVKEAHGRINVEQLSKKEELFQIRFIVHKARKLTGACSLPLIRVLTGNKILRTKPRKGKSPKWNETLLFSINKSELELVSEPIEIRAIDSAKATQFSLIGLYTCDLSVAWVEKGKNLFFKWFALTNPSEPQDGLTGYVNISIQIIAPGESAKDLPKLRDEQIDISDNVFFPPGIILQPGQFNIKLLNGEDMPQMDSSLFEGLKNIIGGGDEGKKELVDPYAKFEFAGTVLESSVQETTFDPMWNEQLIIQGNFPSMAENIILKLYDNDDLQIDDLIATKLLRMDEISHSSAEADQGFLPSFGPAYIPFYGSFREFNDIYDKYKDMNHGVGEGIAYRGRVLVELTTVMGEPAIEQELVSDLPVEDTDRIMINLGRYKYHLFVSFFQGNMVSEKENQVEYEVSIGDYGNKFSPLGSPAPSTTQPCNAVYDGTRYHFMPWSRTKPTVILHSEWEDIEYRVEILNTITWMKEFLEEKLEQYETMVKAFAPEYEQDTKMDNILKELANVLKETPLNEPDDDTATVLDKNLYELRVLTVNNLVDEVSSLIDGKLMYISRPDKLKRLDSVLEKLDGLCFEPQLGIPDVFIWMLSGTKRIAYVRIPVNEIMYSKSKFARGKHCGITGSFFLKEPKSDDIGSHLTLSIWFGKFEHVPETFKPPRGSEVIVYAETYENQMSVLGSWTTKLLPRPVFSDTTGTYHLPLESFLPPEGWRFEDEWFISVDRSLTFDNESGLKEVADAVYEGETRVPGTSWTGSLVSGWWQDIKGDEAPSKDQVECPDGWKWSGEWEVDTNRAVDAEGWEYALDSNIASYSPIERSYHLSRRRKWHKLRERVEDANQIKTKDIDPDGWEYSKIFTTKFHPKERKFDMVRRRRYNRRMISDVPMPCVFQIIEEEAKADKLPKIINMAPRIITEYDEKHVHKYQLRAYLYQARGVLGADPSGYSDPYARVIFGNRSAKTHIIKESVSPVWDTTLILDAVEICGYPEDIACNPPCIVVDIFDDDLMDHDHLGRVTVKPTVFNSGKYTVTKLKWFTIGGVKKSKGDLLAAFEVFKLGSDGMELPLLPRYEDDKYIVPEEIRPEKQLMRVEVLTWGVRQLKDYKMMAIDSPHADIEIGGETVTIEKIPSLKKHPNFAIPYVFFDVWLPIKEEFLPPINIRVMDNRAFGYTPLVAVATIKEYGKYRTVYNGVMEQAEEEEELEEVVGEEAEILKEIMAGGLFGGIDDDSIMDDHSYQEQSSDLISMNYGQEETSQASLAEFEAPESQEIAEIVYSIPLDLEEERVEELNLEQNSEIQIDMEVCMDEGAEHVAIDISESLDYSNSQQNLIPVEKTDGSVIRTSSQELIISNEAAINFESESAVADHVENGVTIAIPQGVIDATQTGARLDAETKKQMKKEKKELKKQEKLVKKNAKLQKKKEAQEMKAFERQIKLDNKQRERNAKEMAKAQYREELEQKKLLLNTAADEESSSEEEFFAEDGDSPNPLKSGTTFLSPDQQDVPEKAAGILGSTTSAMSFNGSLLGNNEPVDEHANISKLSRKETRKLKQGDEEPEPHPDDVLVSDWWSKYYHALGKDPRLDRVFKERGLPTLKLYEEELEKAYGRFRDIMEVIKMQRPDNELNSDFEEDSDDEDAHVGLFKGCFKIYPITEEMSKRAEIEPPELMLQNLPSNSPQDVTVRLYVIAGLNLTPLDFGGSVDPYLWVKCGKTVMDEKANYLTRQINPEFGKCFEFRCSLPRDSQLLVKVYDYDLIGANDLVGGTTIDLEDRFLSWKHASCGVATNYIVDRENKDLWRDPVKPISLLKNICVLKSWDPPKFKGKGSTLRLYVNESEYKMKFFESSTHKNDLTFKKTFGKDEQRLALYVLHELGVIPEHFETRTLFNDDCPGIPQGKLHLWVDIFPYDRNLPLPVNITPRLTEKLVLRIIVWNTQEVILSDENIMGERMSDIYVKINIEGMEKETQQTDVHYRSLTGEGNFNWRMTYDFDYLMAEQKVVTYERKNFFSLDKEMEKLDPLLHIKVYDYDIFSSDDLLGWADLSLVALVPPTKTHKECQLEVYDTPVEKRISIFEKKKIKGFWPIFDDTMGEPELTGKIELEIEIMTEEEAAEKPAGQGRSEPNDNPILEPPDRPDTSFSFFMNPFMVFKILIWDKYKWKILAVFLILLCIAFVALLIYTSPGAITNAVFSG